MHSLDRRFQGPGLEKIVELRATQLDRSHQADANPVSLLNMEECQDSSCDKDSEEDPRPTKKRLMMDLLQSSLLKMVFNFIHHTVLDTSPVEQDKALHVSKYFYVLLSEESFKSVHESHHKPEIDFSEAPEMNLFILTNLKSSEEKNH